MKLNNTTNCFRHPFLQTWAMFFAETMCMLIYYSIKWWKKFRQPSGYQLIPNSLSENQSNYNPLVFFPSALLDLMANSILYLALTVSHAPCFQMLIGMYVYLNFSNIKLKNTHYIRFQKYVLYI